MRPLWNTKDRYIHNIFIPANFLQIRNDDGTDYVLSVIKDNQKTILEDLKAIDWSDAPWHETLDKAHGRIERRRGAVVDLSGTEWDGYANLHGRRQALRIEREREVLNTDKRSIEVTYSLTSLGADRAGPEELTARPGAQPLAYREPAPLRARRHL